MEFGGWEPLNVESDYGSKKTLTHARIAKTPAVFVFFLNE